MALAVVTAGGLAHRHERRSEALARILARQQIRAAALLGVAPLPMRAAKVSTLETDGAVIFYGERFLLSTIGRLCNEPDCAVGAVLGMVAHELAHAYRHAGLATHPHVLELDADWVAGWVLGRAGVCPRDFLRVLAELSESSSHPSPGYRANVVQHGYSRGVAARTVP